MNYVFDTWLESYDYESLALKFINKMKTNETIANFIYVTIFYLESWTLVEKTKWVNYAVPG